VALVLSGDLYLFLLHRAVVAAVGRYLCFLKRPVRHRVRFFLALVQVLVGPVAPLLLVRVMPMVLPATCRFLLVVALPPQQALLVFSLVTAIPLALAVKW